jgi:hypothetical protein
MPIVLRRRSEARRAGIFDDRDFVRHGRDRIEGIHGALHQATEGNDVLVRQRQTTALGDIAQLLRSWKRDCKGQQRPPDLRGVEQRSLQPTKVKQTTAPASIETEIFSFSSIILTAV